MKIITNQLRKLFRPIIREKLGEYACAEGCAHLTIAHALHLPEPTQKNKSEGNQRTGVKRRDSVLRFVFFGWLWQLSASLWVSEHTPRRTHIRQVDTGDKLGMHWLILFASLFIYSLE